MALTLARVCKLSGATTNSSPVYLTHVLVRVLQVRPNVFKERGNEARAPDGQINNLCGTRSSPLLLLR